MTSRAIYVEIEISAPIEEVWRRTQDAAQHSRWDLRFSRITPAEPDASGVRSFTYERRVPFHTVEGVGVSIGERSRPDGSRTSALKFFTRDRISPIRAGRGYWRYVPSADGGTRFITGYDYTPGWGHWVDVVARPVLGWATAWSFDRLRVWIERGEEPEDWPLRSVVWFWNARRPRAGRCRRSPEGGSRRGDHLRDAPATLASLPSPEAAR